MMRKLLLGLALACFASAALAAAPNSPQVPTSLWTPPVTNTAGSVYYWNGTAWAEFIGNVSGTQCFQESSSGVPAWGTCGSGSSGITIGTTTISGGTSGDCLYDNAGVVGNQACGGGGGLTVGTTTIASGTSGDIEFNNAGVLGEKGVTGTGTVVLATSPSVSSLTVTTAFTATGLVTNADLANSTISGISLGSNLDTLTFGTHLTGTSYNGSAPITIATDATNANTASTIVARDASGNFTAGTITAALTGHASSDCALAGCTMTGELTTVASTTGSSGFNLPQGSAPTSPTNGDLWLTTSGLFARVNGSTVGPLTGNTGTVTSIATTSPITGGTITTSGTIACGTCGVTGSPLSQFAATTSAQLAGVISDETGTGALVFGTSPTLTTPALGTPASGVATNLTGLPLTTGVTGILPIANGGTATATPGLVAGTNVTITGSWPNQTINSSGASGIACTQTFTSTTAGGSDFTPTPGTSQALTATSCTLTTSAALTVYFDTGYQVPATYSLSGQVVTITGGIPATVRQVTLSVGGIGGGNVSSTGTPTNLQIAQWTNSSTIQGLATSGTGSAILQTAPTVNQLNWVGDTTSATNPAAGSIGQLLSHSVSAAAIANATVTNLDSETLTAGHWRCVGWIYTNPAGTTLTTTVAAGLNTTASTLPTNGPAITTAQAPSAAGSGAALNFGPLYLNLTTNTTINVVGFIGYTTSTLTANAGEQCERIW